MDQRSDEWFKIRLGKVTGSVASKLVGSSYWGLVMEKSAEIINGKPADSERYENKHTQRGVDLEPLIRFMYELKTGSTVEEVGFVEYNKFAGCSPDGLVGDDGMIEIKAPLQNNHLKSIVKNIESSYMWQIQFSLFVTGRKWCDYISYNEDFSDEKRLYIKRIYPDDEKQEKIKTCLEKFEKDVEKTLKEYEMKK